MQVQNRDKVVSKAKLPKPVVDMLKRHHEQRQQMVAKKAKILQEEAAMNSDIEFEKAMMFRKHGIEKF